MIRHMVLVRFRADVTADEKSAVFEQLAALRAHLPGVLDFRAGLNVSPESHLIRGFNDLFWFDFEDARARDIYLDDPDHKAAGANLVAHAEGGRDGLIVADVEI